MRCWAWWRVVSVPLVELHSVVLYISAACVDPAFFVFFAEHLVLIA